MHVVAPVIAPFLSSHLPLRDRPSRLPDHEVSSPRSPRRPESDNRRSREPGEPRTKGLIGGVDDLGGDLGDGGVLASVPPRWPRPRPAPPVVTAWRTRFWKLGGMPIAFSRAANPPVSLALTIAPRMATPKTAPISLLVLVAEAAIPERSGRTTVRGTEVTGTSTIPIPMPAIGSTQPSVPRSTWGPAPHWSTRIPRAGQEATDRHRDPGPHPRHPGTRRARRRGSGRRPWGESRPPSG